MKTSNFMLNPCTYKGKIQELEKISHYVRRRFNTYFSFISLSYWSSLNEASMYVYTVVLYAIPNGLFCTVLPTTQLKLGLLVIS